MTNRHSRRTFLIAGAATASVLGVAACGVNVKLVVPRGIITQADFFVATEGDDAWTGTLPTPNTGKTDGPFASLPRAQQAVRELARQGLTRTVKVLVRAGTYALPAGLTFGPEDSGTAEHSIIYAPYPGEHPELIGGVRLTEWQRYHGEIREAGIPDGIQPEQVFENGMRLSLARAPKHGYFRTVRSLGGMDSASFEYRTEDLDALNPGAWDVSNAKVSIWPMHNWLNFVRPVKAADPQRRVIRMRGSFDGYEITTSNRYAILNVLALLTQAGECQIALTNRKVYVWPAKAPISQQVMIASAAEHVISIEGQAPGRPVRISGAEDCSLRVCKIENGGSNGVRILGHAQRVALYGNLIRYHGYCGVSLEGLEPGMPDVNRHHRIENNHIHHCGQLIGHAAGVYIQQSGHNQVLHNHIHHIPRYGTTIKGLRYQLLKDQVAGVTWENHYDYLHSRHNQIAHNDIHHANQDSQDAGAMESWGPGRDNVYDHNLVHDSGNPEFDLQSGMYLDDATDHFTVTNNIVWNITGTTSNQCIFAKGIGNRFENNILIVGVRNDAAITSMEMAGEECKEHVYRRNLIAVTHVQGAVYKFINWRKDRIQASDHNLVWKAKGNLFCFGTPWSSASQWSEWRNQGFDTNSVVADPLFVDLDSHDFRLRSTSPALALGFTPIDVREIGLQADFPERFEKW